VRLVLPSHRRCAVLPALGSAGHSDRFEVAVAKDDRLAAAADEVQGGGEVVHAGVLWALQAADHDHYFVLVRCLTGVDVDVGVSVALRQVAEAVPPGRDLEAAAQAQREVAVVGEPDPDAPARVVANDLPGGIPLASAPLDQLGGHDGGEVTGDFLLGDAPLGATDRGEELLLGNRSGLCDLDGGLLGRRRWGCGRFGWLLCRHCLLPSGAVTWTNANQQVGPGRDRPGSG